MKAAVLERFGASSVLQVKQHPEPSFHDDAAVVDVHYASINPIDWKTRKGLGWAADSIADKLPWILGFDFCGILTNQSAVGSLAAGDWVCGLSAVTTHGGSHAQMISVPADTLCQLPHNISPIQAAALPLAGCTAWQALQAAQISSGASCLVLGGAGGVGHFACQIAHHLGATVDATTRSHYDFLEALGVDNIINPTETKLSQNNYDVIIDLVGADLGIAAVNALKPTGRLITLPTITADAVKAAAQQQNKHAEGLLVSAKPDDLNYLLTLMADGKLSAHIHAQYTLNDIHLAHELLESNHPCGKTIISIIDEQ